LWDALCADEAGEACLDALHLRDENAHHDAESHALLLHDFSAWVHDVLESASFVPEAEVDAAVVIVPLSQVLGRPLAALVLPGADEIHLSAAPDPLGAWSRAQRESLGLPSREQLQAAQRLSWQTAQAVPCVDVLWRCSAGAEAVLASPLVQEWRLAHPLAILAEDPRQTLCLQTSPTERPQPMASSLKIHSLSASSYEDMRKCPYRYFALRMLGLQVADELNTEMSKSDYGTWLHAVLRTYHEQRVPPFQLARDLALINSLAQQLAPSDGGFVPFAAMWPRVRDGYLAWIAAFEAQGWQFSEAEKVCNITHAGIAIKGTIDRVDTLSHSPLAGMPFLLDYKTESTITTSGRLKEPLEDTQLAVYAALLQDEELQAAYVNISETGTKLMVQTAVLESRDALLKGLASDVQRIQAGAPLLALGEGSVCNYCNARGLCRKDSWESLKNATTGSAI
jgi:ATP-dependent helicase/nuclease subunit B